MGGAEDQDAISLPFTSLITSALNAGSRLLSYIQDDEVHDNGMSMASPFYDEYSSLFDYEHRHLQGYDTYDAGSTYDAGKAAVKTDKGVVDYTIMSVAVMTLGLLLIVETMFHQLDHLAHHRRFLKTVMSTFYKECELEIYLPGL